jgi:hypothetical protein
MPQVYDIVKFESVMAWLMDEFACPTENPTLLRIRRENGTYKNGLNNSGIHSNAEDPTAFLTPPRATQARVRQSPTMSHSF